MLRLPPVQFRPAVDFGAEQIALWKIEVRLSIPELAVTQEQVEHREETEAVPRKPGKVEGSETDRIEQIAGPAAVVDRALGERGRDKAE